MDIIKLLKENEEYIISCRRWLHEHPEESAMEFETLEFIKGELGKMNIEHVHVADGGILAFLGSEEKGKGRTVLLRADIDALALNEYENNLAGPKPCVSKRPGYCHACGHDGHTAMLLGCAKVLHEHEDEIPGRIILMFEQGEEETDSVRYIYKYIEDNGIHIDTVYGTHLYAGLESGKISVNAGPVMSGSMPFSVTIRGKGGHGSRPDMAFSPVDCFAALYNALNTLRLRRITPFNSLTFSVGSVHSGTVGNVIPDELTFNGTVRVFDIEDGKRFADEMKKCCENTCAAYDCELAELRVSGPGVPVCNDKFLAGLAQEGIRELGGDYLGSVEPWMASEVFGLTQLKWPGVFGFVGINNPEKGTGALHHNGAFDVDESVLAVGAASYIAYAMKYLNYEGELPDNGFKGSFHDLFVMSRRSKEEISLFE